MNYRFDDKQTNELELCLLWIKQAKLWLKPTDNVFIYSSKKLPQILTDEFLPNFKECITSGSKNLESSVPKEYTEMIWYKLYVLCHFPYRALFLDADAIITNDISELNDVYLSEQKPILMIDHEMDVHGHTLGKPPTINSGSMLLNNLSETTFCWNNLIEFGRKVGFIYRYKNSKEMIPGNDQALLQSYCEYLNYDYHDKVFNIKYNTCAKKISHTYKDSLKRMKLRSEDDPENDIAINHYWGPFKPWKINCPLFKKQSKILIKIPTFGRPQQLLESIKSFSDNAHDKKNIYFVVTIDNNDELTNNSKITEQLSEYKNLTICREDTNSKIDAYNRNMDVIDFDILILSSDDMVVKKHGYDKIVIDNMEKYFPDFDGVLWFDTGDGNLRTDTLAIIGKKLYDKMQPLYNQCYNSYYCDDEFGQIATKLGKMVRINELIIQHTLPSYTEMSDDATYLKSLSHGVRDKALYKIRKKVQFDIPGTCALPKNHNIPKTFTEAKRNDSNPSWMIQESKYNEPIDVMELYILEEMDKKVAQMNIEEFTRFAENYFRNFRWHIPHIIHQIWLGGPIPNPIKEMMETFSVEYVKKNPGSRYILWDDRKLNNLKMINRDIFDKEKKHDCKSDIARLEIINKFGGVYIDADTVWLGSKSILSLQNMLSHGIMIAYEKEGKRIGNKYLNSETKRCANSVLGSTIQNPIIAFLIGQIKKSYETNRHEGVVASTGPDFVQSALDSLKPNIDVSILNHTHFYPCWWCVDPKNNPNYQEFMQTQKMSNREISCKYPNSISFHKGFTSAVEGVENK